jgi:UPF0271 protein
MKPLSIDINCDLGEISPDGTAIEYEQLLPWISSASIACGGHCGDHDTMSKAVDLCLVHGISIGAHPSYVDQVGFGRESAEISVTLLEQQIRLQVADLVSTCEKLGAELIHLKPHGALYNDCVRDEAKASVVAELGRDYDLAVFGMGGKLAEACSRLGTDYVGEVFSDRAYRNIEALRARNEPDALLESPELIRAHIERLIQGQILTDEDGLVTGDFQTICVHGDNPDALSTLQLIHQICEEHDVAID